MLTCGRRPVRNLSPMKPPGLAPPSYGAKHGSVFPEDIRGVLRPSSSCWPRRQLIWEKLTREPFAPVTVIRDMQFPGNFLTCPDGREALTTSEESGCIDPETFMSWARPEAGEQGWKH